MMQFDYYADLNDYDVEVVYKYDQDFVERIATLARPYSSSDKRTSNNYSPSRLYSALINDKRCEHGFYIVKHKGRVIVCFGVDDFHGWGVISRYLNLSGTSLFIPFGHGVGIPFAIDILGDRVKGICSTQNVDQKDIIDLVRNRYGRRLGEDNLYGSAAALAVTTRKLPYNIWYRNKQQTAFVYCNKEDPPFLKYEEYNRLLQVT